MPLIFEGSAIAQGIPMRAGVTGRPRGRSQSGQPEPRCGLQTTRAPNRTSRKGMLDRAGDTAGDGRVGTTKAFQSSRT